MPELSSLVSDQRQGGAIYHHMLPELRAGNGVVAVKTKYRLMLEESIKSSGSGGYERATVSLYHIGYPLHGYLVKELFWKEDNFMDDPIEEFNILLDCKGDLEAARLFIILEESVLDKLMGHVNK